MGFWSPYEPIDFRRRKEVWEKNKGKYESALAGLNARLSNRGRNFNGMQLLKALLAAAEISFVAVALAIGADNGAELMVASSLPALVGLACLIIGIIPPWPQLNPRRRDDEFVEALENDDEAWLEETAGRSMDQRSLLRRGRIWLAASSIAMLVAIAMFMASIVQLIWSM